MNKEIEIAATELAKALIVEMGQHDLDTCRICNAEQKYHNPFTLDHKMAWIATSKFAGRISCPVPAFLKALANLSS